jgi:hypothetical protein
LHLILSFTSTFPFIFYPYKNLPPSLDGMLVMRNEYGIDALGAMKEDAGLG